MDILFFATLGYWFIAATAIVWFMGRFRRHVERQTTVDAPAGFADGCWPEALVVMSLRGGDDSLRDTLNGLAAQNYPNYRIRLVIDNRDDEVNRVVRSWRRAHPDAPLTVDYLREPLKSCTLKCSSVHQVLREMEPETGVVVMVDGDSDPYPNWLRDVVAPFARSEVGGVTGNRWYYPREGGMASWARFVFTALSLPTMWLSRFSWGGTLALRGEIARSDEFLNAFAQTPTEEQTCFEVLPKFGKQMHFASQLIQWNPESIGFEGAEQHLFRQLAWSRLFYPCWTSIVVGAMSLWCALIASIVFAGFAITDGRAMWFLPPALAGMFCATVASAIIRLHHTLETHVFSRQGRALPAFTAQRIAELCASASSTLGVYSFALARAHFADEIRWRGIPYRLFSDDTISMAEYVPWKSVVRAARPRSRVQPARPAQHGRQAVGS